MVVSELSADESKVAGVTIDTDSLNLEQKTNLRSTKSCVVSKAIHNGVEHDGCQPRHQPPTLEDIKCGDTPRGSCISGAESNADTGTALHRHTMAAAWEALKQSIVYFRGQPIGTVAAIDKSQAEELNYDQVFMRDFVPSALAFLMKGEPLIVKNFLLETARLQSREKMVDLFKLGQGVMPASFKVHHSHPTQKTETLLADFGEIAIGRVAPVDSGLWWIFLLHAYTKYTLDNSLAESPHCQRAMRLILKLWLSEGFDTSPALLCADGCSMIDRRMGIYGYPIEIPLNGVEHNGCQRHHQPPSLEAIKFGDTPRGSDISWAEPTANTGALHRHTMAAAWEAIKQSIVHFRGQPIGTVAAIDKSQAELKYDQRCRSKTCLSIVRIFIMLIVMLSLFGLASASSPQSCEVASFATNIRVFCGESHPSSLCCDSIKAAATTQDGLQCLCLVGNSPDILTMGFSAQSLTGLHSVCSHHDHEYNCNDEKDETDLANDNTGVQMSRAEADDDKERPHQKNHGKKTHRSDPKNDEERPRKRADSKDSEDHPHQREHSKKTHKSDRKDDNSETKEASTEIVHEEGVHPRNQRKDVPEGESDDLQPQQHGMLDSRSSNNNSMIGFMSGIILLLLTGIVVTAVVLKYRRQRTDFRQLLTVALASALPPVQAQLSCAPPPVHAQGTVAVQAALPVQAQGPLTDPPQIVNGLPLPAVEPLPPLALFPGPAEIVTLLGCAALDRMRRRVWA